MARPNWEYIRVDVDLPDHEKLDGLSDKAFRTLIELWCWCGRHLTDGFVRDAKWKTFGTKAAREQLVGRRLATRITGGYQMNDYLGHQRSRQEVLELKAKRRRAGQASAAARVAARVEHPVEQNGSKRATEAEAEAEADRSMADVDDQSPVGDARANDDLTDLIITELRSATGRTVDPPWAAKTRDFILSGRNVADPAAYVRQVIRNEPDPRTRFLPLYP